MPLAGFTEFSQAEVELIAKELLPLYGKRTSLAQAVVVTAVLLDFVKQWDGEIARGGWALIFKHLPDSTPTSTFAFPLDLARDYPFAKYEKVSKVIAKLLALGWLRVRVKPWRGKGRAT